MVTVVIPVYNVEKYLAECVNSVLQQTCQDYEIILVDDGSTDSSGAICDEYAGQNNRIRVIHQPNGGLSAARNAGLEQATGKYVYFLDSDDYIEPQTLSRLTDLAEKENADVVFFDGYVFFDECEPDTSASRYIRKERYGTNCGRRMLLSLLRNEEYRTAVPLMLFRKEYLDKNNLIFEDGIIHEDELFTFQVYNANGLVCHCHEQLYARRVRPASIMTSSGTLHRYDSMHRIYFVLSEMYRAEIASGEAAVLYLIRTAKSVLGKYNLLSEEDQKIMKQRHSQFKKDVMSHRGFGDMKLKIKCSRGLMHYAYRVLYKLRNYL